MSEIEVGNSTRSIVEGMDDAAAGLKPPLSIHPALQFIDLLTEPCRGRIVSKLIQVCR